MESDVSVAAGSSSWQAWALVTGWQFGSSSTPWQNNVVGTDPWICSFFRSGSAELDNCNLLAISSSNLQLQTVAKWKEIQCNHWETTKHHPIFYLVWLAVSELINYINKNKVYFHKTTKPFNKLLFVERLGGIQLINLNGKPSSLRCLYDFKMVYNVFFKLCSVIKCCYSHGCSYLTWSNHAKLPQRREEENHRAAYYFNWSP